MQPEDKYFNGQTDRECYALLYGQSEVEIRGKFRCYETRFPFIAYGTYIDGKIEKHKDGYYYAVVRRQHSCD